MAPNEEEIALEKTNQAKEILNDSTASQDDKSQAQSEAIKAIGEWLDNVIPQG